VCADPEHDVGVQVRFPGDQVADHVDAHHVLVDRVRLDVLAVEPDAAGGASIRCSARTIRRDPGGEVISVDAKCPIAAPRSERWSPNNDIRFTAAKDSAGTASM
jgi:hypothetical protein